MNKSCLLLLVLAFVLVSCEYEPKMIYGYKSADTKDVYIQPETLSVAVGDTLFLRVESQNGVYFTLTQPSNSCKTISNFLIRNFDNQREKTYNGHVFKKEKDDWHFFGGYENILGIVGLAEGTSFIRISDNSRLFPDTIVTLTVKPSSSGPGDGTSDYEFSPDRSWYVTDSNATISVGGPKVMGAYPIDGFICNASISRKTLNGKFYTIVKLQPNYVGQTLIKFYNEDFDTLIPLEFLPIYNTYVEPTLDFDDSMDSMIYKMGVPHVSSNYGYYVYNYTTTLYSYKVTVNFNDLGLVDNYEVAFDDLSVVDELRFFIAERYYKSQLQWHGSNVYLRAFGYSYPTIQNSYIAVTEDFLHAKVTYRNPENYSLWAK